MSGSSVTEEDILPYGSTTNILVKPMATLTVMLYVYGIYTVLFIISLRILICQKDRQNRVLYMFFTIVLFTLTSAYIIVVTFTYAHQAILEFTFTKNQDWASFRAYLHHDNAKTIAVGLEMVLPLCLVTMADLILLHRCYVIWGSSKWIVFPFIFMVFLLAISEIVATVFMVIGASNSKDSAKLQLFGQGSTIDTAFWLADMGVNIILTLLTAGRIWWLSQEPRKHLGPAIKTKYKTIIVIILESGFLYPILLIAAIIIQELVGSDTEGLVPFSLWIVTYQVAGIAPTLIIIRAAGGKTASPRNSKTSQRNERQLEQDIAEAEVLRCGQPTQSILNPGGQVIPPLTRASRRELLTPLHLPSLTSQPLTETPVDDPGTRRISTPSFTPIGLKPIEHEEEFSLNTPKPSDSDTLNISTNSPEELDPFQRLLQGLKNSPRSPKTQIEAMSEDKKPSGSRPKREEPVAEEAVIGSAMPVQVVLAVKEVKAALPRAFTGARKDVKKFLREVLIYVALNPKVFPDRLKKLFLLSYMMDGPGEFWKNDKTDLLLAYDKDAEKVTWMEFLEDFRTSLEPLNPALKAQLELKDLRMKERADEYTYQFTYLAKQTGYNDAAQIVAFKRGLPRSLALKIMTRPEGAPTTIKDWMDATILFDESYKQALEYGKTWDEEHGGRKPQRSFRKKEEVAIKQIAKIDRKEYMTKGLCFRCRRAGHCIRDCPDTPKKDK
ncbi:hypothetical protein WG66_007462 [Moniliophthora roreri]|nr:hypothetical protein WG66_007462 [Moniliophthora roreri]